MLLFLACALSVAAAPKKPKMGKPKPATDKPEISRLEPRGIQRGVETKIKLMGTNLVGLTELKLHSPKLKGEIIAGDDKKVTEAWIKVTAAADLPRGAQEISVVGTNGESGRVKLFVDDLPQAYEDSAKERLPVLPQLPISFWGTFESEGDTDEVEFDATAGQSLVLDLEAKSLGSKANAALMLFDAKGALLASNNGFDGGDPLLNFKVPVTGRYRVRFNEEMAAGSPDHFYRLSVGEFPLVIGTYPLSARTNSDMDLELIGFNLPAQSMVTVKTEKPGEMDVPVDPEKFRSRKSFKLLVTENAELTETEPDDSSSQAVKIPAPGVANGRIGPAKGGAADVDLFRFDAKKGGKWVIETDAARRGSPIDTKIEVLHADGKPVERLLLQAVRDSSITFRPIDSNTDDLRVENWREMELTQFLYMNGEVGKIFRMPQGPDSGFQLFSRGGKRRSYFDTSGMAHALDEPCYIVEPHPPGTKLIPNGLPTFTLYYANDDDGDRKLGTDSRVAFTAPADGTYLIRVSDTRGFGGERFAYRLVLREPKPDFKVSLAAALPTVAPGSGQDFNLNADRIDGFDEDIQVEISGLPEGFVCSSPIVIQAGHLTASGTINAAADAKAPKENNIKISATAMVKGRKVVKEISVAGKIAMGEKPKLQVAFEPYDEAATNFLERSNAEKPLKITIAPGQIIPTWLKVKRNGHEDLVTFTVDNLPHGVIVDNIGLNGVLIPKGQSERQIFLSAAKWVGETDRLIYAQAKQAGNPTSLPVLLHVRKPASVAGVR